MKKVAVSIHAHDGLSIDILRGISGFDYIHLDIMDGKFVPPLNLNLKVCEAIHSRYNIPIFVHLMVENPIQFIEPLINSIDGLLFHFEIQSDKNRIIDLIKEYGKLAGIVINPKTPVEQITDFLPYIDIVLVLGVEPGWSGQKFNKSVVNKVNKLAEWKKLNENYKYQIDVDGGINLHTAKLLRKADILTSASAILKASDPNVIIRKLKEI
jgi:ribulose-phosphate 3-epimerase